MENFNERWRMQTTAFFNIEYRPSSNKRQVNFSNFMIKKSIIPAKSISPISVENDKISQRP